MQLDFYSHFEFHYLKGEGFESFFKYIILNFIVIFYDYGHSIVYMYMTCILQTAFIKCLESMYVCILCLEIL